MNDNLLISGIDPDGNPGAWFLKNDEVPEGTTILNVKVHFMTFPLSGVAIFCPVWNWERGGQAV